MVRVTRAMTEPSAILTRCSNKSKPSGPECAAYFARKSTQSSVGPRDKDHDIVATLTNCSSKSEPSAPGYGEYIARTKAQSSVAQRDKDRGGIISGTYILQHQEYAIRTRMGNTFRAQKSTLVSWYP
jgi:hypothetical protein